MSVTIKDVAARAGVSISTVSKVIHDSPTISDATKQRVLEVMKELNYHPNIIARSFARQSSYHIGLIMSLKKEDAFLNPYIYEIMGGIEEVARKNGYLLSIINTSTILGNPGELEKLIAQKRVDGLIIHLGGFDEKLTEVLDKAEFPYVFIGRPSFATGASWVDINNCKAGEIATEHLVGQGCSRIAFIGNGITHRSSICGARVEGYKNVLQAEGYQVDERYIKDMKGASHNIPSLMEELLGLDERPDGLVCSNNFIAFETLKYLQRKNINVPGDMLLITFDNYPFAPYTVPSMSTVDIDVFDLGAQSAHAIISKLSNPGITIQYSLLSPSLIVRESSARKPGDRCL